MTSASVHCATCETQIDESSDTIPEDHKPCPTYGSTARLFKKKLEATLSFHDAAKMKLKNAATGKTTLEQFSGDELHKKSGRWMAKQRLIERGRINTKKW